jgi:hypothetical protein
MGYFEILSKPGFCGSAKYKGLDRGHPCPKSDTNKRFISLWHRYCEYCDSPAYIGITTELTLDELKELADLAEQETGDCFEMVFFSEDAQCPYESEYYGADVAGEGGYSLVSAGILIQEAPPVFGSRIKYLRDNLNAYGLFSTHDDAENFRSLLLELDALDPGCFEGYNWRVFHVFRVL